MPENERLDMLHHELKLVCRQIDKYDHIGINIKLWAVTIWIAATGWAFQFERSNLIILSIIALSIFWYLDYVNKAFRQNYRTRRQHIEQALRDYFKNNSSPGEIVTPEFPTHSQWYLFHTSYTVHVGLIYLVLIVTSLLLYFNLRG